MTNTNQQQYAGRLAPSYGKLDYLLHVSDHLEYADRQVNQLLKYPPTWPTSASNDWRTSLEEDQTYVVNKLKDLTNVVASTKKLVCHHRADARLGSLGTHLSRSLLR